MTRKRFLQKLLLLAVLSLALPAVSAAQFLQNIGPSLPSNSPFMGGVPAGTATASRSRCRSSTPSTARSSTTSACCWPSRASTAPAARGGRRSATCCPTSTATSPKPARWSTWRRSAFRCRPAFPRVVGPFNVFDARVYVSQSVLDFKALNDSRAETHNSGGRPAQLQERPRSRRPGRPRMSTRRRSPRRRAATPRGRSWRPRRRCSTRRRT